MSTEVSESEHIISASVIEVSLPASSTEMSYMSQSHVSTIASVFHNHKLMCVCVSHL